MKLDLYFGPFFVIGLAGSGGPKGEQRRSATRDGRADAIGLSI